MTARLTFPIRYFNAEVAESIRSYYNMTIDFNYIEDECSENGEDVMAAFIEAIMDRSDEIEEDDGFLCLEDCDQYDEGTIHEVEETLQRCHIPYDSESANGLEKHLYRPETNQVTSINTHPNMVGTLIAAEEIVRILDATMVQDPTKIKDVILKNLETTIFPAPALENYKEEDNSFEPTGLRDIRLLA